jgi:hypothetical protein
MPSATPITGCAIQFTDVPVGSTFYPYIHCLACLGIVSGYSDGTFRPNNSVTRGQISKIVSNSAGFSNIPTGQQFQDVPIDNTYYAYIYRLVIRGYINGYACGGPHEPCVAPASLPFFRPLATTTRGQLAKVVANTAGFTDSPGPQLFQDVPVGSPFYDYINRLANRNYVTGHPCDPHGLARPCRAPANLPYFLPNAVVTRGQISKITSNTFFPGCALGDIR